MIFALFKSSFLFLVIHSVNQVRKLLFIFLSLLFFSVVVTGQVIDTTKNINTWNLTHNFTRFEEIQLDTNMHQMQRDYNPANKQGFSYEYLGILGHSLNHVDFFLRPEPDAFLFCRAWEPYLKRADRTIFFNTKIPFTSLAYSTSFMDSREENVEALHTQNFSPFTNFGFDFNILSGKVLFFNQATRVNRVGLFGSHAKDKYSIFGTFYYNNFKVQDNGGLENLNNFLEGTEEDLWLHPVNLTEAKSQYTNLSLFITHKYNLFERQTNTDTLGNTTTTGKTLSISHQLLVDRHMKDYEDEVDPGNLPSFYDNYYYEAGSAKDSASEDKISNVFQLILGDPDYDKISIRAYAGHELRRFGVLSPNPLQVFSHVDTLSTMPLEIDSLYRDSTESRFDSNNFNDVYVGLHMAGPTTSIWDWVIDGKYYLLGYYRNDFQVNATFSKELMEKADLGIRGSLELKKPHYFTNNYSSSFFEWEHDFPSLFKIKGEAFVRSDELEMDVRVGAAYLSNYVYWNLDALPQLYDRDLLIFSGYFSKHFWVKGFNSDLKVLLQYTTSSEVLRLPVAALYTSNYWNQSVFKGALVFDIGFDLYFTTKYRASAYMPTTGAFYLQDEYDVGRYPFLDLFLTFRVKRTRIYFSYNNALSGMRFTGNNYFTSYLYPMRPRGLRFGLVWIFYD